MRVDEVLPLRAWIWGTTEVHLRGGHVARLRMTHLDADRLCDRIRDGGDDDIGWDDHRWLTLRAERVDLIEWTVMADAGWRMRRRDREAARANGFEHGPVRALVDFWAGLDPEPRYGLQALTLLHDATINSPELFDGLAHRLEGEAGQALVNGWRDRNPKDAAAETVQSAVDDAEDGA